MTINLFNELIHEPDSLGHNNILALDQLHVAVAHTLEPTSGGISIFETGSNCGISELNKLVHVTGTSFYNSLVRLNENHIILSYVGSESDGFVKIFNIDGYVITEVSSLEYDTTEVMQPHITLIDSSHFLIAFSGVGQIGVIKTFEIDGSYQVTPIDTLIHDATNTIVYSTVVLIDSNHFTLAYTNMTLSVEVIKTFGINGSYQVSQIDYLEHGARGLDKSFIKYDGNHYVLTHTNSDFTTAVIKTFTIDGLYQISLVDSLVHDTYSKFQSLHTINNGVILAYSGEDKGTVKLFEIDGAYNISQTDNLEYNTDGTLSQSITMTSNTHGVLSYMCYIPATTEYGLSVMPFSIAELWGNPIFSTASKRSINGVNMCRLKNVNGVN